MAFNARQRYLHLAFKIFNHNEFIITIALLIQVNLFELFVSVYAFLVVFMPFWSVKTWFFHAEINSVKTFPPNFKWLFDLYHHFQNWQRFRISYCWKFFGTFWVICEEVHYKAEFHSSFFCHFEQHHVVLLLTKVLNISPCELVVFDEICLISNKTSEMLLCFLMNQHFLLVHSSLGFCFCANALPLLQSVFLLGKAFTQRIFSLENIYWVESNILL